MDDGRPSTPKAPLRSLASRVEWECPWYRVRVHDVVRTDGTPGLYNVVEKGAAVFVVPVTTERQVALVRSYRVAVDDWCLEIPAGGVEPGVSREDAARRELREEVGGVAEWLEYHGSFYTLNSICDEIAHVYLATGVALGATAHEPGEVIEVVLVSIAEALNLAHHNRISDGPSALAVLLLENRLRELVEPEAE